VRVAGLLSGTSADGVDVAIVDIDGAALQTVAHGVVPYASDVREAIFGASNAVTHTAELARLNVLLGEIFAEALAEVCRQHRTPMRSVELVGSHGQTVYHQGDPAMFHGRAIAATLQIGEAAVLRERTGIPVVSDFRAADVAAGGQGAPLVPFLDYRLFRSETIGRAALNIGGIANVTILPPGARLDDVVAFDTGPGNMLMDALVPPFDRDGAQARTGKVNEALLERLLSDRYYHRRPPKSAGREQYGAEFVRETGIDISTACELTARTIAMGLGWFDGIGEVIVSGGGAHNGYLLERLRVLIPARIVTSDEYGVDIDAKEAVLFALLAYERWHGRPANVPSATGARTSVLLGKISA
jgi:anhydro-N-acetylmuramic acid kinase